MIGLLGWAIVSSCSTSAVVETEDTGFTLTSFAPAVLVPGTKLVVQGTGFTAGEPWRILLQGTFKEGGRIDLELTPTVDSGTQLSCLIERAQVKGVGASGEWEGKLIVQVVRGGVTYQASFKVSMGIGEELEPRITKVSSGAVFFGDVITLDGDGFLLGGQEGTFVLEANGEFTPDRGGAKQAVTALPLEVRLSSREKAAYVHTPAPFGLRTGEFAGTFTPINIHKAGREVRGQPVDASFVVLPSSVVTFNPTAASRAQKVKVAGTGFYANKQETTETMLRFDGNFVAKAGTRRVTQDVPLRVETSDKATLVLLPVIEDDQLVGVGSTPGTFDGTVTPIIVSPEGELAGSAWRGVVTIKNPHQVVVLRFTPGFLDALGLFGLRNVDRKIRDRIFEVARRDYADYNIEFREDPPTDFDQWTTVEITGDDPNGADLLGLDNSSGKDINNLRLNDYVGGANPDQVEAGSFAFGGVFLGSMLRFSLNICAKTDEQTFIKRYLKCNGASKFPLASPKFDEIFASFIPLLGGKEAEAKEWDSGPRKDKVREAVLRLGNIAGNTSVHELGHSLGLAQEIGIDEFHNPGDTEGYIMNPGSYRSFAERAETDDPHNAENPIPIPRRAATWAPGDAEYLQQILGMD